MERGKIYFEITPWEGVFLTLLGFAFPFYDIVYTYVEKEYPPRLKLFWLLFCIGINAALFTYFYRKQKMNFYRNMSETYRDHYNKEYAQFLNYRESQEEADRFRHDMDNHFLVIKEMLLTKEYGKASAYMEQLLKNRELGYYPVLTGNEVFSSKNLIRYLDGLMYHQTQNMDETVSLASRKGNNNRDPYKKLPKGTYYAKVFGMKGWQQSGYYSLKWK